MAVHVQTGLTAYQAIELSAQQGDVVHLAYSPHLAGVLLANCECQVASPPVREYWGDGWRVYLHERFAAEAEALVRRAREKAAGSR